MIVDPSTDDLCSLETEFGAILVRMVAASPGAIAAVLTDDDGDPIDFAYDPVQTNEFDVQLMGAQFSQPVLQLHRSAQRHRLHHPSVLIETNQQKLFVATAAQTYTVVLQLDRRANIGTALRVFAFGRKALERRLFASLGYDP